MKTGVSYMGHHNPKHIAQDIQEMRELQLDDCLAALQENDFIYFPGKAHYVSKIARDNGIRPIAIFWGALNLFGGGKSSHYLLTHPDGFQQDEQGRKLAPGCYMNPNNRDFIKNLIDQIAEQNYAGYFIDEPTSMKCYCPHCRSRFPAWYGKKIGDATSEKIQEFRKRCVRDYVENITQYCKNIQPELITQACLMPSDEAMWKSMTTIPTLDDFGTDHYIVNHDTNPESLIPKIEKLDLLCRANGKKHHEWFQCWEVRAGKEDRIKLLGETLLKGKQDSLYVWAWHAQVGTSEASDNPELCWRNTREILKKAKGMLID